MKKQIFKTVLITSMAAATMVSCSNSSGDNSNSDFFQIVPEHNISEYDVISIGDFHNGLAKYVIRIAPEEVNIKFFEDEWTRNNFINYYSGNNRDFTLCGYCNINGDVIILPEYDEYSPDFIEDATRLEHWNGWKQGYTLEYINKNGKVIYSVPCDEISDSGEVGNGLFWIEENDGNLEYFNTKGKSVFKFENATSYDDLDGVEYSTFSNGRSYFDYYGNEQLAIIEIDGVETLINNSGEIVKLDVIGVDDTDPEYDSFVIESLYGNLVEEFSLYSTERGNKKNSYSGVIDLKEKTLTVNENEELYDINYSSKIYDENQNVVLDLSTVDGLESYKKFKWEISEDGIVSVCCDWAYYGLVGLDGRVYLEPTSDFNMDDEYTLFTYSDGLCAVKSNITNTYGYIDLYGNWVILPVYRTASNFSDGVAVVNDTMVIDKNGNTVLIGNEADFVDINNLPEEAMALLEMLEDN